MADTGIVTGDNLARKAWAKKWKIEAETMSFFYDRGLVGADENNAIIQEMAELQKEQGDKITYGLTMELEGAGVQNDSIMEGNEEEVVYFDDAVEITQLRNAVRFKGAESDQIAADNSLHMKAQKLLSRWLAAQLDQAIFTSLGSSLTKVIYGGDATTTATIEAGDYMALSLIGRCVAYAEKADPLIIGPTHDGIQTSGVFVMSPDQSYDLTSKDGAWIQAQMDAQLRGKTNPIFTKAMGMHKNVPLYSHSRVGTSTTWGSGANLNGATGLFLGVGSGVIAYSSKKFFKTKSFDYDNKKGFCVGSIFGADKSVFNGSDYATIGVRTYRTNN